MNYLKKFKTEDELQNFIINRIKFFRVNKKITQAEMAYMLNMSEQNYGRIERGRYKSGIYFILNFCSKMDITFEEFFKFNKEKMSKFEKEVRGLLENNEKSMLKIGEFINYYFNKNKC